MSEEENYPLDQLRYMLETELDYVLSCLRGSCSDALIKAKWHLEEANRTFERIVELSRSMNQEDQDKGALDTLKEIGEEIVEVAIKALI